VVVATAAVETAVAALAAEVRVRVETEVAAVAAEVSPQAPQVGATEVVETAAAAVAKEGAVTAVATVVEAV
jgi:hypothetical protein